MECLGKASKKLTVFTSIQQRRGARTEVKIYFEPKEDPIDSHLGYMHDQEPSFVCARVQENVLAHGSTRGDGRTVALANKAADARRAGVPHRSGASRLFVEFGRQPRIREPQLLNPIVTVRR